MSIVTYREARADDFPVLSAMYAELHSYFYTIGYRLPQPDNVGEAWLESFRRSLGRFSNVFIAELEGEIGGFMLCRIKRLPPHMSGDLAGELSDMWIIPAARRLGIGKKLSRLAINWLWAQGAGSVEIQILRDNEASLKLYERMGFEVEYRLVRLFREDDIDEDA
ncbi:MAG: GNAT family N-acetyltransferase [Anaerolineales bacterium]|jgi:ribosomal protein S18 acetylase RimI-like enzyme